jgi:SAM-dependent methyltransferase
MFERRAQREELMDDPMLDAESYAAVLKDLAQVNTLTLARRPTLAFLKSAIGSGKRFRLLDVGYGDGDMLRAIASWAASRGIEAELVGIDLNPRSEAVARAATDPSLSIRYQTGDYDDLSAEPFDFIVSSLVAHHMTPDELISFLHFMDKHARKGWFVNDLHRHGFAWGGFWLLSRLMMWHPIVRHDGQLSIARSYRPGEWPAQLEEAGVTGARVFRAFPFRLCVSKIR